MAKYTEDTKTNTDLHQQMPAQNTTPEVDRQNECARYTTLHCGKLPSKLPIENEIKNRK